MTTDEMKPGGVAVYVAAPSKHPDVNDGENVTLEQCANDILNGLLLQGVPRIERGFVVHGANVKGKIEIRSYSPMDRHELTAGLPLFTVGMAEIRRPLWLSHRLRYIQVSRGKEWGRLIRGIRTLLLANRVSNEAGARLHQLVRTVEALVKPAQGNSREQFAHRGQALSRANAESREVLLQLYDLRSAVEHLNVPHDVLPGTTEAQRIATANHRTRQADILARFSLIRVLESPIMFNTFRTDADIEEFWRLRDHARADLWGERLDLLAIQ
jgi:hypothetical protein